MLKLVLKSHTWDKSLILQHDTLTITRQKYSYYFNYAKEGGIILDLFSNNF